MSKTNLTRRSFVKVSALAGAAAAVGASMAGCMQEAAPEEELAGTGEAGVSSTEGLTKMRTSCHGCIQMCPAIAYLKDGVVVRLEGDPEAPVSRGSLCIKGLNQLHTMYSPRRILHPLRRAGERGENKWEVISWDEAITEAATHIKDAIDQYGNYAFFASVGGGGSYSFMEAMTLPMAFGSPTVFEPGCAQCYLPRWALSKLFYGGDDQSIADNAVQEIFKVNDNKTEVVVIWGAQPSVSETAESGRGMAELRAAGVKTVVVDPNFSPDAVKADVWLPVRPGTDTKLLLSWFRYIFENKLYDEEFTKYWTNLPFLIDPDTKLPVKAQELFPDFKQTTPENTPAYVCFDLKTNAVAPFEYSAPADSAVDPEIFWAGEFNGKQYKTAGQIYKEEADPWTLEKTAEECWLQADKIEEAIKLYVENNGGIANGVASDMTESASQVPLGCMGLDSIMGRINKPGVTMTQKGGGYFATMTDTGETKLVRPVTYNNGFGGMFSDMYGVGAVIGMSDAENEARIKQLGEAMPDSQRILNKLLQDRLGMKDHKGLYAWCHSHIPTVRNAIATGEPFKPRVWFDMSGNKLAMLGNAKSWYDVFPEVDYIIGQYPMLTSFHIEACDLVFPLREWLEEPMVNMTQLDTQWLQNECVHIGETVSHSIPAAQVVGQVAARCGAATSRTAWNWAMARLIWQRHRGRGQAGRCRHARRSRLGDPAGEHRRVRAVRDAGLLELQPARADRRRRPALRLCHRVPQGGDLLPDAHPHGSQRVPVLLSGAPGGLRGLQPHLRAHRAGRVPLRGHAGLRSRVPVRAHERTCALLPPRHHAPCSLQPRAVPLRRDPHQPGQRQGARHRAHGLGQGHQPPRRGACPRLPDRGRPPQDRVDGALLEPRVLRRLPGQPHRRLARVQRQRAHQERRPLQRGLRLLHQPRLHGEDREVRASCQHLGGG